MKKNAGERGRNRAEIGIDVSLTLIPDTDNAVVGSCIVLRAVRQHGVFIILQ